MLQFGLLDSSEQGEGGIGVAGEAERIRRQLVEREREAVVEGDSEGRWEIRSR